MAEKKDRLFVGLGSERSNGERTPCEGRKDSSQRGNTRLNQKHGTYVQEVTAETLALFP